MTSFLQALEIVFKHLPPRVSQPAKLDQSGLFFLAEDITTDTDLPSFDNSAMDGFAVQSKDTKAANQQHAVNLDVIANIPAGSVFSGKISTGQAAKISTGSPIPEGADAVIPVELTVQKSERSVALFEAVQPGAHIRYSGEDIKSGSTILRKNERLNPARIALLASIGQTTFAVYKKPVVGFVATGDELVEPHQQPGPGQIRNSNSAMIRNLCESQGFSFIDFGIAGDSDRSLLSRLRNESLPDILITSAGISVGEHDIVGETLKHIGLKQQFWKVAIKPGKPLMFGTIGETLFFGLPGNPVSGAVMFMQFIEPVLCFLAGNETPFRAISVATAQNDFKGTKGRLHFARGISFLDGNWQVKSAGTQGSHILSSMAEANCFMLIPPDQSISAGDTVAIQHFEGEQIGFNTFKLSIAELLK